MSANPWADPDQARAAEDVAVERRREAEREERIARQLRAERSAFEAYGYVADGDH